MKTKQRYAIVLLAAVALVAVPAAWAQEKTEKQNYSFDVGEEATFEFSNVSGDVKIIGWDRPVISIDAVKRGKGRGVEKRMGLVRIEVEQRGDKVECEVKYPDKQDRRRHGVDSNINVSVDFTIRVPRNCNLEDFTLVSGDLEIRDISGALEVSVVSGDIEGGKVGGKVELSTVSGDIELNELHGKLEISSTSGDIELSGVTGRLETSVTSGNIDVEAIDLESMEAQTTSGDISMNVRSPVTFGDFSFKVMSGDVEIRLPRGSAFELYGKTATGNISSDYDLKRTKKMMRKTISGQVGDRGADINISTFDGDIIIRR